MKQCNIFGDMKEANVLVVEHKLYQWMKHINFSDLNEANIYVVGNMVYEHRKHDNSDRVVALGKVCGNKFLPNRILVVMEANSMIDQIFVLLFE